jgi:hypothetical protein
MSLRYLGHNLVRLILIQFFKMKECDIALII